MTAPFPTRKQEEWRYADLDALQPVWEQFAEPRDAHRRRRARASKKSGFRLRDDVQVRRVQTRARAKARRRACSRSTLRRFTAASSLK